MKTRLLVLVLALTVQFVSAQLNFKVLNSSGTPQEGVDIKFYQPGWASPIVYQTAVNGIAVIPATAGNVTYPYEMSYTGTDGVVNIWGWGSADFSGGNDFQVSQNYPFFSGDNLDISTLTSGSESTINFNVTNNSPGEDIWTAIEVWISKDQVETDFHYTMGATEKINSGTERLYTIAFTPAETGDYFWKAIVHYNDATGGPTSDSFNWTSAFTAETALGVDDVALNNTITVFPNPAIDDKVNFNLSTEDFIDGEVVLFDIAGRIIVSKNIDQNSGTLNVAGVSAGIYFIKFINEDKVATQKVILK